MLGNPYVAKLDDIGMFLDELGELATADPAAARLIVQVHPLVLVLDGSAAKGERKNCGNPAASAPVPRSPSSPRPA